MTRFIDRSNVNGADDYAKAGVTHIYLKVTQGALDTAFVDSTFLQRRAAAHAAGAIAGGYHFAGHEDPIAEADFFLAHVGHPRVGQLRPCLDLEDGQSAAWAEAFVKHLHAELGYWPVLYGSTSFIAPMRAASAVLRACPWWRAEYGPNDGAHHALQGGDMGCSAHQYTSVARFPGISGDCDASVFLDEAAMLVPTPAAPKPAKPKIVGSEVSWVDKADKRQTKHLRHVNPHAWLALRHPRAWRRGQATVNPVRKK